MKYLFILLYLFPMADSLRADVSIQRLVILPSSQSALVQSILPFRLGDSFDPKSKEIARKLLMATDKFEDAVIQWDPTQAALEISVRPKEFFDEILWVGDSRWIPDSARSSCVLTYEPRAMSQDRFSQIRLCLSRTLKGRGYLDAEVGLETRGSKLVIEPKAGSVYTISELGFLDNEHISDTDLFESIQNRKGRFFEAAKLEDDTKALLKKYFEEGYYFAEIFKPNIQIDTEKKTVGINWKIRESYPMDIRFTGHRKGRRWVNEYIERDQTFPAWFVDEIVDELTRELKEEGYLNPEISVSKAVNNKGGEAIDIHTRRGPNYRLSSPEWVGIGNKREVEKAYESISELSTGSSFEESNFRKALSDEFVPLLVSRGYLDARLRNLDFVIDNEKSRVRPVIYLNEGDLTIVHSVSLVGLPKDFERLQEAKDLLGSVKAGDPFNVVSLEKYQTELQRKLVSLGFLDAAIQRKIQSSVSGVDLVVSVSAGVRYRVAKILVKGAVRTDYEVLRREVLLAPGDFYEDEKVKDSISHIFRLGLARSVDIQVLEKDSAHGEVYVLVDIYEAARFRFEVGPGYGTLDGLRGVFKATYANIGGTARRLTLYSKASRRFASAQTPDPTKFANPEETPFTQRRISLEYFEPSLFSQAIDGRLNYTHAKEEKNRLGQENSFTASLDYRLNRHWLFTSNYELAFSDPFNVMKENMKPGDDQPKRFTNVGEVVVVDYLNDSFNPSRGSRTRLEGNLFDARLGGEVNFWQTFIRQELFAPIWVFRKGKSIGLALNIGAGFSESYDPSVEVPIEKRSQIGGESTVRGFSQGSINPKRNATQVQEGGNSYFFFQSELNLPVAFGVDLLGFFDGGNAYLTNRKFKPWDLRYGAGPGLRWNTPVGPLKVGYGFRLFRRDGEGIGELYIGVGAI